MGYEAVADSRDDRWAALTITTWVPVGTSRQKVIGPAGPNHHKHQTDQASSHIGIFHRRRELALVS